MAKKTATSLGVSPKSVTRASRPPVVAVLGHVDHGKTTLLDYIRKANVASREHGGITQHIGAYQIAYKTKSKEDRFITFIDTPGHVAFSKIRSRGASAADIAILVVAANDGVKPQTIESISQIQSAGIPMIVAINKIDLPGVIVDKVKSDLAKHGVQVEGFGGDVPCVLVSAKEGKGVADLLELILLIADMKELTGDPLGAFSAVVIEAKVDKFRGQVATVLVKSGTIGVGTLLFEGDKALGRVRALFDESGAKVEKALPGKPVEVLGFSFLPSIGVMITSASVETASAPAAQPKEAANVTDFLAAMTAADKKRLKLLIKADTSGSLEAVLEALPQSDIDVVSASLGEITEADILVLESLLWIKLQTIELVYEKEFDSSQWSQEVKESIRYAKSYRDKYLKDRPVRAQKSHCGAQKSHPNPALAGL